jgi:hypothetical protein
MSYLQSISAHFQDPRSSSRRNMQPLMGPPQAKAIARKHCKARGPELLGAVLWE